MIKPIFITLFCLLTLHLIAQNPYEKSISALTAMLNGQTPLSFKKTVFSIENVYFHNQLSEQEFDRTIAFLLNMS